MKKSLVSVLALVAMAWRPAGELLPTLHWFSRLAVPVVGGLVLTGLTLAIIQVIVARAGGETFAIPLDVVKRVLVIEPQAVELIGDREVCVVRGHHVPLIRLDAILELDGGSDGTLQLVLVQHGGPGHVSRARAATLRSAPHLWE